MNIFDLTKLYYDLKDRFVEDHKKLDRLIKLNESLEKEISELEGTVASLDNIVHTLTQRRDK